MLVYQFCCHQSAGHGAGKRATTTEVGLGKPVEVSVGRAKSLGIGGFVLNSP
jgi:hypothetical protein